MKVIGGNFGLKGGAFISRDKRLIIESDKKAQYGPEDITSLEASTHKEKKFSILSFLVGAVILSFLLGMFLNVIGVILGIVLAVLGSYYSDSDDIVDIGFNDGKRLKLQCTPRGVKKLFKFAPQ